MSTVWIFGLGAAFAFIMMKQQQISSSILESAAAKYDSAYTPENAPGATFKEVKQQWANTKATVEGDFSESLPAKDRNPILAAQRQARDEEANYDGVGHHIEGVYLQTIY